MRPLDPPPLLGRHDPVSGLRHDHRVRSRSVDWGLLVALRSVVTDRTGARRIVATVCASTGVTQPRLGFHARRRPDTGQTRPPIRIQAATGRAGLDPRRYPPEGHLQLSATPTLGIIAHELAHHLVFHHEPIGTPAHGLVWVGRQDETARLVAGAVGM